MPVKRYNGSDWEVIAGDGIQGPTGPTGASATTVVTTKGDLLGFSTTAARLGVGANATVLTADSAEATGLKWAAAPTPSYTWTAFTPVIKQGSAGLTLNANSSRFINIGDFTVVQIKVTIGSAGTAANSIRWDNATTTPNPPTPTIQDLPVGQAFIYDNSAGSYSWGTVDVTGNAFYPTSGIKNTGATYWGQTGAAFDQTLGANDILAMSIFYRSA